MYRLIITAALFHAAMVHGATVYKTVDEHGVVSFSDVAPKDLASAEVLEITPALSKSPEEYVAWLDQMRETTDRLAADRREREQHRAKLREARARTAAYAEPAPQVAEPYPVQRLVTRPYSRPYWRGNRRSRPQPVFHPPLRSARIATPGSNAQLMRPLVSSPR